MLKNLMLGATALVAVAVAAPDMASARPGGGGGAHFGGGGGFRAGGFAGGAPAFRGAAVSPSFRSAAVASPAFRSNAIAAPNARVAQFNAGRNWNGNWNGRHHFRRGFGYGGLAAAPYYYNNYGYPYDDTYYDNYAYGDGYYNQYGDNGYYVQDDQQDASCYVQRRVHTRYGWRLRTINVCG